MESPSAQTRPRRGWRRGLIMATLALALAWVFRDDERRNPGAAAVAPEAARAAAPRPLPTDAVLTTAAQARPRLLALLARPVGKPVGAMAARVREACGDRLALTFGDEAVAAALDVGVLPTFILYDAAGKEEARFTGPDAVARLADELQARGLPADALRGRDLE